MTWPQDAYVGQKVVCIVEKCNDVSIGTIEPGKGDIGTIRNIYIGPHNHVCIELKEFPSIGGFNKSNTEYCLPGWYAYDFRPVQTNEKGMEMLRELLNPINHKVLEGV